MLARFYFEILNCFRNTSLCFPAVGNRAPWYPLLPYIDHSRILPWLFVRPPHAGILVLVSCFLASCAVKCHNSVRCLISDSCKMSARKFKKISFKAKIRTSQGGESNGPLTFKRAGFAREIYYATMSQEL